MQMMRNQLLKEILIDSREHWDHVGARPAIRVNFLKIIQCGTRALGAEVYASETEKKVVCHTCKSRFCPSCGSRATELWQDELEAMLPDTPYVGINFTMPKVFWPIFQQNRNFLKDLPAIGASVIERWVKYKYGVRVYLFVVCQTFGGLLNFNCHLHMLISAGGFQEREGRWVSRLQFDELELMQMWRLAVVSYLWVVLRLRVFRPDSGAEKFEKLLEEKYEQKWIIFIGKSMSKTTFVRYAGRYIRRSPLPQNHILEITESDVRFLAKERKNNCVRLVTLSWSKGKLVDTLGHHVPDRYRHGMRYFGLLAPRTKRRTSAALFALLKQKIRPRPARLSWPELSLRTFGTNLLVDSHGQLMHWVERQKPAA